MSGAVYNFAGLAELTKDQRKRFEIDEYGNHVFWTSHNVSIDLDVIRYKVDEEYRKVRDISALSDYKDFVGQAIRLVMANHRLTQSALKDRGGPAERHLYWIERGQQELKWTMINRLA